MRSNYNYYNNNNNSNYYDRLLGCQLLNYQSPTAHSLPGHTLKDIEEDKKPPEPETTKKPTTLAPTTRKPTTVMPTTRRPTTVKPKPPARKLPPMPDVQLSKLKGYVRTKDECVAYYAAGRMQRTVHLHVLGKDDFGNTDDITLVTQMTSERYDKLYNLAVKWSGPISVAVYVERGTTTFWYTKKMQSLLAPRRNIALHLVSQEGDFFPVNFLRNVALENAETKYVFLTDVDFEPMPKLDIRLQDYISKGYLQGKTALVVAVFEAMKEDIKFPKNKHEVLELWKKDKTIRPFHFRTEEGKAEESTPTQSQTDYPKWVGATEPYAVQWAEYYEPYIVIEKEQTPKYWPEYVGRFFNKESQLAELFAQGFNFVVLPDLFTIHTPHLPQPGTEIEQKCGRRVNARFKIYLMDTYRWKMPVKIVAP